MTFWEFFPRENKNITFAWRGACDVGLNPCKVRLSIEMNIPARVGVWAKWGEGVGEWGQRGGSVGGGGRWQCTGATVGVGSM